MVVVNNDNPDRFKYITYSDMYIVDYSAIYSGGQASASIDVEGQITSAINYVTTETASGMLIWSINERRLSSSNDVRRYNSSTILD